MRSSRRAQGRQWGGAGQGGGRRGSLYSRAMMRWLRMASAAASQRRELPPVAVDECGSPKAWCRGGGSQGPAKFGREALGGGAHRRLGSVVVSVHNPTQDDGLRH
jgi:hypothetical protein